MDQAEHAGRMEDAGLVRQARQGLIDTAGSQDAAAKNAAQARAIAAGVLKPEAQQSVRDRYLTLTQTDQYGNKSEVAVDPATGKTVGAGGGASNPKQADGTLLKGKDGRTYKVVNGVPTPV
jgi:hypothetical protein